MRYGSGRCSSISPTPPLLWREREPGRPRWLRSGCRSGGGRGAQPPQERNPRAGGWARAALRGIPASTETACACSSGMGVWGAQPPAGDTQSASERLTPAHSDQGRGSRSAPGELHKGVPAGREGWGEGPAPSVGRAKDGPRSAHGFRARARCLRAAERGRARRLDLGTEPASRVGDGGFRAFSGSLVLATRRAFLGQPPQVRVGRIRGESALLAAPLAAAGHLATGRL